MADLETLGFGSHLIVDGFQANAARLTDVVHLRAVSVGMVAWLEPDHPHPPEITHLAFEPPFAGVSAGLVLPESHLLLHTFSHQQRLTLDVFSHHEVGVQRVLHELSLGFEVGRCESHLGRRERTVPRQGAVARRLRGDRAYIAARLDETLLRAPEA